MRSEQFSFKWSDFLEIARCLQTYGATHRTNREAAYRSAVSRAYFAAFGFAVRAAIPHGFKPAEEDKVQDHTNLRTFYKETLFMIEVAENLDDLRIARNSCDYDDQVAELNKVHKDAVSDAQDTINWCEDIPFSSSFSI
jgi:uncharacterized protein (UPF0332 family)